MNETPTNIDPTLDEQLVAYLDNELSAEAARAVEERLSRDPVARRRMQQLDRTWQMLDSLETARVDDAFSRTTVELVAAAAEEDLAAAKTAAPRRRVLWILGIAAGLLACAAAGFAAVWAMRPDPNRELVRYLPVIENLETYSQAGDIEFIRLLATERVFAEPQEEAAAAPAVETPRERRERIESLSPGAQYQLAERLHRFEKLPADERERLVQFNDALQHDASADELWQTTQRYAEWHRQLPLHRRTELADLGPRERVDRVKQIINERTRGPGKQPPKDDIEHMLRWIEGFVGRIEPRLRDNMGEHERQQLSRHPLAMQRWMLMAGLVERLTRADSAASPPIDDRELAALREELSPETRARLEARPAPEQLKLVAGWLQREWRTRWFSRQPVDEERLLSFFEKDLTDAQRERLLSLSGDEMHRELQKMYQARSRMLSWPMRGGAGGEPGKRPGSLPGVRRGDRPPGTRGPFEGRPLPPVAPDGDPNPPSGSR